VLAVIITWPLGVPCRLEAQRRRDPVQHLQRERPAKAEQQMPFVEAVPRSPFSGVSADHSLGRHSMPEGHPERPHATAQPTDRAGQADIEPAQRIGRRLHALGRQGDGDALFDRRKQTGQPGGQEVWQQTERSAALRAVPSSDPQPSWRRPGVAAMASKGAAARGMQGAAGQSCVPPFPVPDVRIDARRCSKRKLQRRSPARWRSATRARELCGVQTAPVTAEHCVVGSALHIKTNSR
jgi:hypothetical protein